MASTKLPGDSKEGVDVSQELLTIDELAERLKVPKSWIYSRTRLKGPGALPHLKLGKYLRFCFPTVLDSLERQQNKN
jgi:hypothetical protein